MNFLVNIVFGKIYVGVVLMNSKSIIKPKSEKLVIFEVFKQDGQIWTDYPNEQDTQQFELLGFLETYIKYLRESLLNELKEYK